MFYDLQQWFNELMHDLIGWRFNYSQWELYHTNKDDIERLGLNNLIEVYKKIRHRDNKPKYKRIVTKINQYA